MNIFIVEVETGCTSHGDCLEFDSAWSSEVKAKEYCQRFETYLQSPRFEITEITLDAS